VIRIIKSDQQSLPVYRFDEIDIESVEIRVSKTSKYIRKKYSILDIPENIALGAIVRNDKIYIPDQHTEVQPGDELLLFAKARNIKLAEDLFI
jgi:trk system potassium uptake protein TrkA